MAMQSSDVPTILKQQEEGNTRIRRESPSFFPLLVEGDRRLLLVSPSPFGGRRVGSMRFYTVLVKSKNPRKPTAGPGGAMGAEGEAPEWDEVVMQGGNRLAGLAVDQGTIFVASSGSGEVMTVPSDDERDSGGRDLLPYSFTGGVPSSMAFDSEGALFVADFAFKCILSKPADESEWMPVVADYEGRQFFGPNSICFAKDNGTLFFTDSGPMGDTSLSTPKGSVFCVPPEDRLLKPLAFECLAHPAGIVSRGDGSVVYVAETMANRVLRFVRKANDVYYSSVFYQFNGGLGPTALALDRENRLYVARYEFAELGDSSTRGSIAVLDETGTMLMEIPAPGPEMTGMVLSEGSDGGDVLYVSEQSSGKVFQLPLGSFYD